MATLYCLLENYEVILDKCVWWCYCLTWLEQKLWRTFFFWIIQKIWQLCRTESGILTKLGTKAILHTLISYVILTFPKQCTKHVMCEQIIWILKSSILSNYEKLKYSLVQQAKKSMVQIIYSASWKPSAMFLLHTVVWLFWHTQCTGFKTFAHAPFA